jgi:ATP-dependent helicase YprA (DUF1998 family)
MRPSCWSHATTRSTRTCSTIPTSCSRPGRADSAPPGEPRDPGPAPRCAAAQELPLAEADDRWFGPILPLLLDRLTTHGTLRRRPTGWYWPHLARAIDTISIRSTGGKPIEIIEESTGRILGTVDPVTADRVVHPGAIYLHQGEHWLVTELDGEASEAYTTAASGEYDTIPVTESDVTICADQQSHPARYAARFTAASWTCAVAWSRSFVATSRRDGSSNG